MNLAKLIAGRKRRLTPVRSALERRWSSDRRVIERRTSDIPVTTERRSLPDRRAAGNRRSGLDRRGNRAIMTLWSHRCSQVVEDHRQCGQPAILHSRLGWRCYWHLDQSVGRRRR